jgi:hypothetical protein
MKASLEKTAEARAFRPSPTRSWRSLACAAALGVSACTGAIGGDPAGGPQGSTGSSGTSTTTGPSSTTGPASTTSTGVTGTTTTTGPVGTDPYRVAIHRLNNREYDNTMRDLMGATSNATKTFINDETVLGFDNIADGHGMTPAQYEQYFEAADALVEQVFASASLRMNIMTCMPASATDTACLTSIVSAFGLRAWRRPLTDAEVTRLIKVAADAITLGEDVTGGVKQVVKSIVASLPFLYRIETDPNPTSITPHPLNAYELASRLSYLVWSTMPDAKLFAQAKSGDLVKDGTLTGELDRLLADKQVNSFVTSFAGQWLGMNDLQGHQVEPTAFPDWNEPLRQAMIQEGLLYFQEFLSGGRSMNEFFTADVNFVNAPLAALYGISGSTTDQPMKVTNTSDTRLGFMGLASFLTFSSFTYRTAPTLRGKWVLEYLLCENLPPPPMNVPELDANTSMAMAQSQNVRVRLEKHRSMPECAACHAVLDPIGMGLENFDAIGRYRTKYANGDAIDSSGVLPDASGKLPDGVKFTNLAELTKILSQPSDQRLLDCTSKTMFTYALSRAPVMSDDGYLNQIRQAWKGGNLTALLKQIVLSDTFRARRGEPM